MLETNMDTKIVIRTTTKSALKTENRVINSAPILMVSFEFMPFSLHSPLFVLFSFTRVLLSFLLFIHGRAGCSFQSKKKEKKKRTKKTQLHHPPTGQHGGWRPHGDQSDMRTTGVSLKCSPLCLRKEQ